jgi:flagellin
MALTLGASSAASFRNMQYLNQTKSLMDKSLQRISSGKRILNSGDDPGGLAFSMRLQNELTINNAVRSSVENAKSFVEMQDSALKTAGDVLTEMASLKLKHGTASSATDKAIYAGQFRELQVQLNGLNTEKLNGVSLFSSDAGTSKTIYTSSQGASGASLTLSNLDYSSGVSIQSGTANRNLGAATSTGTVLTNGSFQAIGNGEALSISQVTQAEITSATNQIATLRAQSGGKATALGFASDYLETKSIGLQSAHSRIMDADIAEETLNYSKYSLQYQAGAAALAQSNLSMQVVLDLLKFPSIRS